MRKNGEVEKRHSLQERTLGLKPPSGINKLGDDDEDHPRMKLRSEYFQDDVFMHGLRYQMSRYCRGKKDALGPKAVRCLREILFSQTKLARASRTLRQQHDNICDLNEEDYDILQDQSLLKLDAHGHVIEPTDSCMNKIPMRRSLRIRDIARMSAQSIAGLFPMAEAALRVVQNPMVLVMDPNKSPFVVKMVLATISSILFHNWNVFFSSAFYVAAFVPMYKIDNSCMDLHNMHPVPARFRLLGSMMSSLLCTSIYSFVLGMGTSVDGVVLAAGALGVGLAAGSREFFYTEIIRVLRIEGNLTPPQRLKELFSNIMGSFLNTLAASVGPKASAVFGFEKTVEDISYFAKLKDFFRSPFVKTPAPLLWDQELVDYISRTMSDFYARYCPELIKSFGTLATQFEEFRKSWIGTMPSSDDLGFESFFDSVKASGMFNPQILTHVIGLQALSLILEKSACYTAQLMYNYSLEEGYHNKSSAQLDAYYSKQKLSRH
jgi:hypothetical protein